MDGSRSFRPIDEHLMPRSTFITMKEEDRLGLDSKLSFYMDNLLSLPGLPFEEVALVAPSTLLFELG